VFQRHNETCNIWTHLVGLAIFIAITISMAYDWGRYRLPRLPDTWTFGDESFNATKKAVYGHLRDFAAAAEDTRRRLRVAAENIRAEIGTQMLSQSDQVRDAVNAMTDGKFIFSIY
jgi:hypothetical protein